MGESKARRLSKQRRALEAERDLRVTSAVLARSLSWDHASIKRQPTKHMRKRFGEEAMRWQQLSQHGAWAEIRARIHQRKRPRQIPAANRLIELHGIMGAIGEQVALCWTVEQDAQRFARTKRARTPEHQTLILRALCESSAHFLLGAAHSLGNLVLRASLLNARAAQEINRRHKRASGFPTDSDEPSTWLTLIEVAKTLQAVADVVPNTYLQRCIHHIAELASDPDFQTLNRRRGMDYHRRRPQSVPHASPRGGNVRKEGQTITISMSAPVVDPEADADRLHAQLVRAMTSLLVGLRSVRQELPKAIRAEGIVYHEDYR